ncbi:hypothetical protein L7F22_023857 [Adiantum nelumboides]|nr:hypothetical protein [Adiantum nelumboides]
MYDIDKGHKKKKNLATTRRGQSSSHEAKARKKTKDTREKYHVYDIDTLATSNSRVHPKRQQRAPSPSPLDGRRSSNSHSSRCSDEDEKKGEKKQRKKKPSRSPPSQSSFDFGSSSSFDANSRESHKRRGHQNTHAAWKRSSTLHSRKEIAGVLFQKHLKVKWISPLLSLYPHLSLYPQARRLKCRLVKQGHCSWCAIDSLRSSMNLSRIQTSSMLL